MTRPVKIAAMPTEDGVVEVEKEQFYKNRIAAHLHAYMRRHRIKQVAELERRLGVHSGTGTRLLNGERCGLGSLVRVARLLGSADFVLFESPSGSRPPPTGG